MAKDLAPIALFAYRRTRHLAATLDALERCPEFPASPVFIFSDGPKSPDAEAEVRAVRQMLVERRRPNMTIMEAPGNMGLSRSIIAGVTELCEAHGRVIVIEDDLVVSRGLLTWFNAALDRYCDDETVWEISGYQFPVAAFRRRDDSMFLHIASSWGWATWARAWKRFDPAAEGWQELAHDAELRNRFDLNNAYPYAEMLERQMAGKVDSWAIRFWWTIFKMNGLVLFPARSLVTNIGDDETATHAPSRISRLFDKSGAMARDVPHFPRRAALDDAAQQALEAFLRRSSLRTRLARSLYSSFRLRRSP